MRHTSRGIGITNKQTGRFTNTRTGRNKIRSKTHRRQASSSAGMGLKSTSSLRSAGSGLELGLGNVSEAYEKAEAGEDANNGDPSPVAAKHSAVAVKCRKNSSMTVKEERARLSPFFRLTSCHLVALSERVSKITECVGKVELASRVLPNAPLPFPTWQK